MKIMMHNAAETGRSQPLLRQQQWWSEQSGSLRDARQTMQTLREITGDKFELFEAAPENACAWVQRQFVGFELEEYLAVLHQSNGLGEIFAEGQLRFVHNMLLVPIQEALDVSQSEFNSQVLVIGHAGVGGILFALQPSQRDIFAYYPIDQEFVPVANSLEDFLRKCSTDGLRL
jgi:hypothetical protein